MASYFNHHLNMVLNESGPYLNAKDLQGYLNNAINPQLEKAGIMWRQDG